MRRGRTALMNENELRATVLVIDRPRRALLFPNYFVLCWLSFLFWKYSSSPGAPSPLSRIVQISRRARSTLRKYCVHNLPTWTSYHIGFYPNGFPPQALMCIDRTKCIAYGILAYSCKVYLNQGISQIWLTKIFCIFLLK